MMSWDNDHSVIVNWHKGNLTVLSPRDEDDFRIVKDDISPNCDEIYEYPQTDRLDPECRDVNRIVRDALNLYFTHKEINRKDH